MVKKSGNSHGCGIAIPLALSDLIDLFELIIDCTPAASAAGVRPGMPVSAALGLLGDLHVAGRDREAERQALQRLAAWCYQYSSQVCIPGDRAGLLIEAGASRRLFGRPEDLGRRLAQELGRLGYHVAAGSAPTPEAAWLAAREGLHITGADELRRQLGPLPLQRLHLEPPQLTAMERMGFRQLRDLLRLPRKALTRRFGPAVSDYLDRLLGARADPRALVQMATGSGKTFTAVNIAYRLLKFGGAKRILFLVDRGNLAKQTFNEFAYFSPPDDARNRSGSAAASCR